jgi:hypothetical protein
MQADAMAFLEEVLPSAKNRVSQKNNANLTLTFYNLVTTPR